MLGYLYSSPAHLPGPAGFAAELAATLASHGLLDTSDGGAAEAAVPGQESVRLTCALLQLADHLLLDELRQRCEAYLSLPAVIDIHNVCGLLTHAHGCNAPQLVAVCRRTILAMPELVAALPEWERLPQELKDAVM